MKKKNDNVVKNKITNRKLFIIFLYSFTVLCLAIAVFFFVSAAMRFIASSSDETAINYAYISLIVACVSLLALGVSLFFARKYQKSNDLRSAYYNPLFDIYTETGFKLNVARFLRKKEQGPRLVTSIEIQNFQDGIILNYGYDTSEQVIARISRVLRRKYYGSYKACYAYTSSAFLLYRELDNIDSYKAEFKALEEDINKEIEDLNLNISILLVFGVYFIKIPKESVEEMIRKATIARYKKIGIGKQNIVIFDEDMINQSKSDLMMMNEIERGLKNDEFEVYYQPKFDIHLDRFVGAEALVRWNHPKRGLITPGGFIPFAEKTGIIINLNRFIIERVCKDIATFKTDGVRLVPISFNLSRLDLNRNDLLDFLKNVTEKHHVNPRLLEVEVTESAASGDILFANTIFKMIKQMNFRIAMDDFGTGYSSLSALKKLPLDTIKVDKSFFDDIEVDKKSRDITYAIFEMAKSLNLYIVAEGIETQKQVNFLKKSMCDAIQGFYYSKALTRVEFEKFLTSNRFEKQKKEKEA